MYGNDTFFNLTVPGQIGLAVLSAVLCILTIGLFLKISSRFGTLVKVLIAIVFLWAFTWCSPQVYYAYYWLIIDGLPVQLILQNPPGPVEIIRLLTFTADQNLSDHSKGLLFWLMVAAAMWQSVKGRRQDPE